MKHLGYLFYGTFLATIVVVGLVVGVMCLWYASLVEGYSAVALFIAGAFELSLSLFGAYEVGERYHRAGPK